MTRATPPESKVSVQSFARDANGPMIPVNGPISYFSMIPLEDSELQRLIFDPAAAAPAGLGGILPKLRIVIVGYLEGPPEDQPDQPPMIVFQAPSEDRRLFSAAVDHDGETFVYLAVRDEDMADSHDSFYYELARAIVRHADDAFVNRYVELIREELKGEARGELDERGWLLKEELLHAESGWSQDSDLPRGYVEQSLADTLGLYLHGLCCDIDVESGPRQLPSKWVRKRLLLLKELLPPPSGFALFPDELTPAV